MNINDGTNSNTTFRQEYVNNIIENLEKNIFWSAFRHNFRTLSDSPLIPFPGTKLGMKRLKIKRKRNRKMLLCWR